MKKTTEDEKNKFINEFEKEVNDKVVSFELAELRASSVVFDLLKLKSQVNSNSIWGLIVFCERENYFYSFSQENYISFYVRKATGEQESVSQCISLSSLNCRYEIPTKHFFDFLFPRKKYVIKSYFLDDEKINHSFELFMQKKAVDLIDLFFLV